MSKVFWVHDNGQWMVATPIDFEPPKDRIVEIWTKKAGPKRIRLATAPSRESYDKYGNKILIWGKSDIETTYGQKIRRHSTSKGGIALKGRMS
jgi:hypothetical protein